MPKPVPQKPTAIKLSAETADMLRYLAEIDNRTMSNCASNLIKIEYTKRVKEGKKRD